ncbi:hypothetical protein PLICRDRAFT_322019 [Plicaturopsis crispa FD-325 SS-3]|nr:hypothetical protein PLICRDRAFT_322019 [Plicaturopsis crispa FD-325 SS-3]
MSSPFHPFPLQACLSQMPAPESRFVVAKDYVPNALLPIVIHTADVPPMPPYDCRSEWHPDNGYLHPGGFHYLRKIRRYDQCWVEQLITEFNDTIADKLLATSRNGGTENLTIHVDGVVEEIPPGLPTHVEQSLLELRNLRIDDDLARRTDATVLKTAATIYHQLFPSVSPTSCFRRHIEWGKQYQYLTPYVFADWTNTTSCTNAKMAVFVVPPWYMAPRDMRDFVYTRTFTPSDLIQPGKPPDIEQKRQHYWAMVNDVCYMYEVHHFAFTTYEEWAFGSFSDDFVDVTISEVRGRTARYPTILETFLFWMHSACGGGPGLKPSQVGQCPPFFGQISTDEAPCTYQDLFVGDPKAIHAIFSCY